jgi:hypothetical protein
MRRKSHDNNGLATGAPFIDPPDAVFGSLQEWAAYRAALRTLGLPGLEPFIAQADKIIESLLRLAPCFETCSNFGSSCDPALVLGRRP